jgi:NAD(P)-dependent dehydrogenase (short-subunit alcohol dehydrogenase family)
VDLKLTGKVALVTGSTAGIGFSIAKSLASEGALVYVNGRTRPRVDAAIAAIRSHASVVKVDGIAADFSGSARRERSYCQTACGRCAGKQRGYIRAETIWGHS